MSRHQWIKKAIMARDSRENQWMGIEGGLEDWIQKTLDAINKIKYKYKILLVSCMIKLTGTKLYYEGYSKVILYSLYL